ncbi:hypothetical protein ACE3G8_18685 [Vreelandella venusta]
MSKKQHQSDERLKRKSVSNDAVDSRDPPLKRLKGSVREYHQPFESVSLSDWEADLLEGLTPDTAHTDAPATPSLKEFEVALDRKR